MVDARILVVVLGFLSEKHYRRRQPKVGPEGVDNHGPAHIGCLEDIGVEGDVDRVEDDFQKGDSEELKQTGPP